MTYQEPFTLPHQLPIRLGVLFSIAAAVGITLIAMRRTPIAP